MYSHDGLVIRISSNNYHLLYDPFTADWWVQSATFRKRGLGGMLELREERRKGLHRLVEREGVDEQAKGVFERWIREGPQTLLGDAGRVGDEMMVGT